MPLDANLFLQGAALAQRDKEMLLQNLQQGMENQYKNKALKIEQEKAKTAGFDLEKLAQATQIKKEMGIPTTPEENAMFDTFIKFQSAERGVDPTTGNLYPKFQWGSESTGGFVPPQTQANMEGFNTAVFSPGNVGPQGQGSNPALTTPYDQIQPMPMDLASVEQQLAGTPVDTQSSIPPQKGFNTELFAPKIDMPQVPMNNPKAAQAAIEGTIKTNLDLQKDLVGKQAESAIKKEEGRPKAEAAISDAASKMANMDQTIDEAINMVANPTAGLGSYTAGVKGTSAYNLSSILDTIKADAAFTEIQKMRANSPTGGALGSITERELQLLQNAVAALDQGQSPDQLKANLKKYKKIRSEALQRASDAFEKEYGYKPEFDGVKSETKRRKYNPSTGKIE